MAEEAMAAYLAAIAPPAIVSTSEVVAETAAEAPPELPVSEAPALAQAETETQTETETKAGTEPEIAAVIEPETETEIETEIAIEADTASSTVEEGGGEILPEVLAIEAPAMRAWPETSTAAFELSPEPQPPETSMRKEIAAAEPARTVVLEGFATSSPFLGSWKLDGGRAEQTDPKQFFAKLAAPLVQARAAYEFSFSARSIARGRGWVGIGLHVFAPQSRILNGYGAGDSLCIWLTRDPVHFKKGITRLQLYRSLNDLNMRLLDEVVVGDSIYEPNEFRISVDPAAGRVTVSLNGTQRLVGEGIRDLRGGAYVIFRALDRAEFSDFRVEAAE
jgi:hypothetical protein